MPILEDYRKDNVDNAEDTFDSGTSYKSSSSSQNLGGPTTYDPNASDSEGGDTCSILATPKAPCNISVQVGKH